MYGEKLHIFSCYHYHVSRHYSSFSKHQHRCNLYFLYQNRHNSPTLKIAYFSLEMNIRLHLCTLDHTLSIAVERYTLWKVCLSSCNYEFFLQPRMKSILLIYPKKVDDVCPN